MWSRLGKGLVSSNPGNSAKKAKSPSTYKRGQGRRKADTLNSSSRDTTILKAMSNHQRLEILSNLMNGEERSVSELESTLKTLSQSALSQHLGRLRDARIVKTRRDSQMIFYSLEDECVQQVMELLSSLYTDDPALINKPDSGK